MCIPALAALAPIAGVAAASSSAAAVGTSVAVSIAASLASAGASIAQGVGQARVAKAQAKQQNIAARDAIERGRVEEDNYRNELSRLKGSIRARQASSGALVDSGSALDVLEETAGTGELDALMIRANAEREAWELRAGARQTAAAGRAARTGAVIGAAGTLLSSAGRLATRYYGGKT